MNACVRVFVFGSKQWCGTNNALSCIFRQTAEWRFCLNVITCIRRCSSYLDIHTNPLCSHTGYDVTAASNRLQNAMKYCIKVHKTGAAGKESIKSAIVWRRIIKFYTDIHATTIPNVTLSATSGRQLSKFEKKRLKMPTRRNVLPGPTNW